MDSEPIPHLRAHSSIQRAEAIWHIACFHLNQ